MRRSFDVVCSVLGLFFVAPLFAIIAIAIKRDDGGSVFYQQVRIGKGLREFNLYKFRSMVPRADRTGLLTSLGDTRVTQCGAFLRRVKLDELPQLINVIKGEMQLVGPRPEVPRYVNMFRSKYEELLRDRPGITDPATLAFCREERTLQADDLEAHYVSHILPYKLKLSLQYQMRRTFFSDLVILMRTVFSIVSDPPDGESFDRRAGVRWPE